MIWRKMGWVPTQHQEMEQGGYAYHYTMIFLSIWGGYFGNFPIFEVDVF